MTQLQEESTELGKKPMSFIDRLFRLSEILKRASRQVEVLETIGLAAFYSKFLLFAGVACQSHVCRYLVSFCGTAKFKYLRIEC